MSKKAIIFCISVIVVLAVGVAVAVSILYSGVSSGSGSEEDRDYAGDSRYGLFSAVPSDAVMLMDFASFRDVSQVLGEASVFGRIVRESRPFNSFLSSLSASEVQMKSSRAILSLHYSRDLVPLLVIDAGRQKAELSEEAAAVIAMADTAKLYSAYIDGAEVATGGSYLEKRSLIVISASDVLVKSSERHISQGISVLSLKGFHDVAANVAGDVRLFLSNANADKLASELFRQPYSRYSDFFRHVSDWTAFSVGRGGDGGWKLSGKASYGSGAGYYMNTLLASSSSLPHIHEVLPSYTVFAASLPMDDAEACISAYGKYSDARIGLTAYITRQKELKAAAGISPEDWAAGLGIREVGTASFYMGDTLESLLYIRTSGKDLKTIFKGTDITSLKNYTPAVHPYVYKGFAASLFGRMFSVADESSFTFIDGWIIAGSRRAVEEYVSGRALENTLRSYLSDAGCLSPAETRGQSFFAYLSLSEDRRAMEKVFRPAYSETLVQSAGDASLAPVFLVVGRDGTMNVTSSRIAELKGKAPVFERDTVVTVPKGPFRVKNSGTGKTNLFYQQENMYLCLQEEDGKGIWGVKFSSPLCGRASSVDYFANGKLQILFASGSRLYLIDRLGRFVNPFPVELGKEVLIGPDVYDFSGQRRYNVMVLHKDNTIDMYNLQGRKPADWKGITFRETIKDLPEAVKVDGKTWWVVRTSIQTLIFPFYGGEPVTVFEGNRMLRPDTAVVPVKGGVEATRYDGKKTTIELK